jgi:hypothetical protein
VSGATARVRRCSNAAKSAGLAASAASRSATARAAASPIGTAFDMSSNALAEKPPSCGSIRMSVGFSEASEARTFCSVRMFTICAVTPSTLWMASRDDSGVPRLTAMTISAPIARAMSTGRLFVSPPSTSSLSPISAGAIAPGTDMLARMTDASSPSLNTTARPVTRSVATARYGIGSWSKSR